MQHKWMVLLSTLILFSLLLAPTGITKAYAQADLPECPPYEPELLRDKDFLRSAPLECLNAYRESVHEASSRGNAQPTYLWGPDAFGYSVDDTLAYNWVSATTNSGLTGDDEFTGPIDIGFNFPFYGVSQSQLYISTNGLITFGAGSSSMFIDHIPSDVNPNNFIAPFWNDMIVGSPYNSGAIYYKKGGSTPNRYIVIEWRDVENYQGTGAFSFEAILYENGNILFQYQSVPSSYYSVEGIEGVHGYQGMEYESGSWGVSAGKAIQFSYPTTPSARILAFSLQPGHFAAPGSSTDFEITIMNQGTLGTDRYQLTTTSLWPVAYYASNGITPLTDTDGDTTIDTGPIPAGSSTTIIARYTTPAGAVVGDSNAAELQFTSSLNNLVATSLKLSMSVPSGFATVFSDEADGAMSFLTATMDATSVRTVTAGNYMGHEPAVARLPNGNYLYVWEETYWNTSKPWRNIEYVVLGSDGTVTLPITKLADNSGLSPSPFDETPSIAVAPDGTIGIVWSRRLENSITKQHNSNIFLVTLNSSGTLLTGPTQITNNTVWGTWNDYIPELSEPTIAATSDNRFVIGWSDSREVSPTVHEENIWYAVRDTAGTSVKAPAALTSDDKSHSPILNSLTNGRVIVTWGNYEYYYDALHYGVINSNGTIVKSKTMLDFGYWDPAIVWTPAYDAVQLPNGKVALAWVNGAGLEFAILNSSYNLESGPHIANDDMPGGGISVITDSASHIIMTWVADQYNKLFYALGDSTGAFLTQPMLYHTNREYIHVNWNGQGSVSFNTGTDTISPEVTSIKLAHANPTSATSVNFTVTFSEPVLSVDVNDFMLNATGGITGASISSVTGSGATRTVTVNTGSGNGTLSLSLPVSASITDLASNPISGLPFTTGATYTILKTSTFDDVQSTHWAWSYVERLYNAGITGGCLTTPLKYCPDGIVTRAQMAIFLERGIHGSSFAPPTVSDTGFGDVKPDYWAAKWIKQLAADGITSGCGNGNYCPENVVTRAQMAIFLLRSKHGVSYTPPVVGSSTGFGDVQTDYWAAAWIKQLVAEGITSGCGNGNYCPENPVTRAQMAVFLVKTFGLP